MKYQSIVFNEFEKIDWEDVAPNMKRKIMGFDDKIMMVLVHFQRGGIGARHKHPHSQTTFIVSGKFEVTVGDNPKVLKANDGFYIPPDVEHGAICLEEGVLLDVFSPIREDFMEGKLL